MMVSPPLRRKGRSGRKIKNDHPVFPPNSVSQE